MLALNFLLSGDADAASPIYKAVDLLGPYVIGVVVLLCAIYGIILGVRLSKAEEAEDRKKVQKTLVNFVVGAVSVIILLVLLYTIRDLL